MKILSLFDWIACWYEALLRAWIKIDKYYASEIDKYAIQIAQKNHPDIIEVWDVQNIVGGGYDIDLLLWWSPCQWFSVAWKKLAFDDPRSKLFFEYVRVLKETKPRYFLLENVKMKKEWQDIISRELWVEPIEINSSLVSAQNRKRLYRTNIPGISQPKDKWILLKDVLEEKVDEKYYLSEEQVNQLLRRWKWRNDRWIEHLNIKSDEKIWAITSHCWAMCNTIKLIKEVEIPCATQIWNSPNFWNSYGSQKAYTLRASNPNGVIEKHRIRKLTPIECERLQTLPDNYTEWVSDTQRYKMLWNWRTVDVIAHILSFIW